MLLYTYFEILSIYIYHNIFKSILSRIILNVPALVHARLRFFVARAAVANEVGAGGGAYTVL
jgi:hypothetical protein